MRYKLLGPSGLRVSELCLGTMSFGDAWGFGADEKESHRILGDFAEAGGNFIDTANKYHEGQSEEIVGSFLGPGRDRWVVATKYTLAMRSGDPNAAGNSRKNLRTSVEASLRRLRTDYLDVLWVHAWDYTTPVEEVMRGLDDLVQAGKVHHVALSGAPAWIASQANTLAALRGWNPFVALQMEYSLLERTAERELLPVAEAFGLSVTAWAPMAAGILTGKYTRGSSRTRRTADAPPPTRRASPNATSRSPARSTGSPTSWTRPRRRWRPLGCGSAASGSSRSSASANPSSSRTCSAASTWSSRPSTSPAWTRPAGSSSASPMSFFAGPRARWSTATSNRRSSCQARDPSGGGSRRRPARSAPVASAVAAYPLSLSSATAAAATWPVSPRRPFRPRVPA
jgi:aryl-alcohol dehydrogenase-like predicted oxidoreductase